MLDFINSQPQESFRARPQPQEGFRASPHSQDNTHDDFYSSLGLPDFIQPSANEPGSNDVMDNVTEEEAPTLPQDAVMEEAAPTLPQAVPEEVAPALPQDAVMKEAAPKDAVMKEATATEISVKPMRKVNHKKKKKFKNSEQLDESDTDDDWASIKDGLSNLSNSKLLANGPHANPETSFTPIQEEVHEKVPKAPKRNPVADSELVELVMENNVPMTKECLGMLAVDTALARNPNAAVRRYQERLERREAKLKARLVKHATVPAADVRGMKLHRLEVVTGNPSQMETVLQSFRYAGLKFENVKLVSSKKADEYNSCVRKINKIHAKIARKVRKALAEAIKQRVTKVDA
jgi:hypothetical protein